MNKYAIALGILAVVGCKKGDDCEQVYGKMSSAIKEVAGANMKDKFLAQCHKDHDKFAADPQMKCILDASGDDAVRACLKKGFEDYSSKSKATDASMQLMKLGKMAKVKYIETGAFPIGKAKVLPAAASGDTCCGGEKGKCAVSTEWASDPIWKALEFSVDEPSLYRFSYEGTDGKTFTATAVGDADCDGKAATFTLNGTSENGGPAINLVRPPEGAY
jgi:hypothetical protein